MCWVSSDNMGNLVQGNTPKFGWIGVNNTETGQDIDQGYY